MDTVQCVKAIARREAGGGSHVPRLLSPQQFEKAVAVARDARTLDAVRGSGLHMAESEAAVLLNKWGFGTREGEGEGDNVSAPEAAEGCKDVVQEPPWLLCLAEARRRLPRGCWNMGCRRLEGDSEAGEGEGQEWSVCGGCRGAWYCCRECQAEHWSKGGHKRECKRLRMVGAGQQR